MKRPDEIGRKLYMGIKREWKTAFLSAFVIGLLVHLPVMLRDIPNHDGLGSMYFDQNMITSGRWFLTVACGFSSYYALPWLIGLLGLLYLSLAAVVINEFLEIRRTGPVIIISGLLVSFPAMASAFAYVFTMDGYMLGLLLAVSAALLTKKYRYGFLAGAVCLAFSLGTYQAYLPFAVLLCLYGIVMTAVDKGSIRMKAGNCLRYVYMGVLGLGLYYGLLQILLRIQGRQLASYQGINGMGSVGLSGLASSVKQIYGDFLTFTLKGNVLFNNVFSLAAILVIAAAVAVAVICRGKKDGWWKSIWFYLFLILLVLIVPIATSIILIISPQVTYHLLMRHQWILFLILGIAFAERYLHDGSTAAAFGWSRCLTLTAAGILVFNYAVTDNIAYSNLEKRYEKTYAYCLRLLDRMEETEGYYRGIPVAMIGVVGDELYPVTDITLDVTGNLIGIGGDSLLYTGENYGIFMKNYLGVELNTLDPEEMEAVYTSDSYRAMDSFPGKNSMKVVDGILYVKTENNHYD